MKNQEEAKKHLNEHQLNGTGGDQGVNTFVMLYDLRGGRLFRLGHKAAQFCDREYQLFKPFADKFKNLTESKSLKRFSNHDTTKVALHKSHVTP